MKAWVPVLLLASVPLSAQQVDTARIDAVFAAYAGDSTPGCIVGVRRHGRELFAKAYGMANLEYGVPLTLASISESGSVAKQFTAAALALLHLEGRLSLDDDVRRHLPELPDFGERITIRHLLNHTSGLRDQWAMWGLADRWPGSEVHTIAEVLDLASRQRELNFPVGSEYLYSNTGYTLAGVIVSRVAGMPFARFTEERLFKPLGMHHTQWRDDYRRVVPQRATAYSREGNAWVQDMPFTMVHGNGGLLTTVRDLLIWNEALDQGLLGKPELTRLLETRGVLRDGLRIAYALGLTHDAWRADAHEIGHGGSTAGYRAYLARYPQGGRLSVALLCNAATANAGALARRVAAAFLPAPMADRTPLTPAPAIERERIVGTYRLPLSDGWFNVSASGDFPRVGGDTLVYLGPGLYRTRDSTRFRFEPSSGPVQRVTLVRSDGETRTFERVERPAPPAEMHEYAGEYASPELGTSVVVRADGGRLVMRVSPDRTVTLSPWYRDGFRLGEGGTSVRFVRDAAGRIIELRAFAGRARNVLFERRGDAR